MTTQSSDINILLIKKQFLHGIPINKINFNGQFNVQQQREILNNTINDSLVKKYPIKHVYQQRFLRKFVEKLENDGSEIDDNLYESLCKFLSINDTSITHYRHYLFNNNSNNNHRLIIKESKNIISHGTTGLCTWQAAEALAEWCLINKCEINGKSILELGSGVGLTGLTVLSMCKPNKYTFTDCHSSVLELLYENINNNISILNNNCSNNIDIDVIDFAWESIDEYKNENWTSPNLILAADVVYDINLFHSLITALKILLNNNNGYAIMAITVRNESTVSNFIMKLGTYGLRYKEDFITNYSIFYSPIDVSVKILRIYK